MSTVPRKDESSEPDTPYYPKPSGVRLMDDHGEVAARDQQENKLLACPRCDQEMVSPGGELPVHMYRGVTCLGSGTLGAPPKFGKQICPPLTIPDVDELSPSEILTAITCLSCGGSKEPGQTICRPDYGALPYVLQKALPPYIKGYLFSDEEKLIAGQYTKKEFMNVFRALLETLAKMRGEQTAGSNQQTAGGG